MGITEFPGVQTVSRRTSRPKWSFFGHPNCATSHPRECDIRMTAGRKPCVIVDYAPTGSHFVAACTRLPVCPAAFRNQRWCRKISSRLLPPSWYASLQHGSGPGQQPGVHVLAVPFLSGGLNRGSDCRRFHLGIPPNRRRTFARAHRAAFNQTWRMDLHCLRQSPARPSRSRINRSLTI